MEECYDERIFVRYDSSVKGCMISFDGIEYTEKSFCRAPQVKGIIHRSESPKVRVSSLTPNKDICEKVKSSIENFFIEGQRWA